jgi:uncharacterized protein DUF4239
MFDLPLILVAPMIVIPLVLLAVGGLVIFRRRVRPQLRYGEHDAHYSATMVASIMVFYGLAMALIAVHVWVTFEEVSGIVSHEAATLGTLYRNVSEYPEPQRSTMQAGLRNYVEHLIRDVWPEQHHGKISSAGVERMDRFQAVLLHFEPTGEAQKLLAAETIRAYDAMIDARRMRLDAVETHLPGVMWWVIILGAVISLFSAYFFPVRDAQLQATQIGLLAIFIGLVIFLIVAIDRPFRGDLGIPSTAFQIVYDQLMTP